MAWAEQRGERWYGRFNGPDGQKCYAGSYDTAEEAKQAAERAEEHVGQGAWFDPLNDRMTLARYWEHWMASRQVQVNTALGYQTHWRTALAPTFGDVELRAITRTRVQQWVTAQTTAGETAGNVVARFKLLNQLLGGRKGSSAVNDGLILANPCTGIELPKVPPRDVDVYTVEEYEQLRLGLDPYHRLLADTAVETGMRWGELMGLRVLDLDLEASVVAVSRTILEVSKRATGAETPFQWKDVPKSGKTRRLAIGAALRDGLANHVSERQLAREDRIFAQLDRDGAHVRTREWPEGLPISRNRHSRYVWIPAHVATDVRPRRFHDLRGSNLTWLLAGGADLAVVKERAGHASIETTQGYLQAVNVDRVALAALERARAGSEPEPPPTAAPGQDAVALALAFEAQRLLEAERKKAKKRSKAAKKAAAPGLRLVLNDADGGPGSA